MTSPSRPAHVAMRERVADVAVAVQLAGRIRSADASCGMPTAGAADERSSASTITIAPIMRARIVNARRRWFDASFSDEGAPEFQWRERRTSAADVEDQRDAAVAHDGGARDVGDLAVVGFEVLDDHLLLAEQFVDQQRDAAALGLDDDHDRAARARSRSAARSNTSLEVDHRHVLVAHLDHAAACRRSS